MTTNAAARDYLEHLGTLVKTRKKFKDLFSILHDKEFVWLVPNDDNRIADALEVRAEWADENGADANFASASFLEVLIALSRRMAFMTDEDAEGWAWRFLVNLGLDDKTDRLLSKDEREVDEILDACIWRTYKKDGRGGFFPLQRPHRDQREVEIWYQMQDYVGEIHPEM